MGEHRGQDDLIVQRRHHGRFKQRAGLRDVWGGEIRRHHRPHSVNAGAASGGVGGANGAGGGVAGGVVLKDGQQREGDVLLVRRKQRTVVAAGGDASEAFPKTSDDFTVVNGGCGLGKDEFLEHVPHVPPEVAFRDKA